MAEHEQQGPIRDRNQIYLAEKALLEMVRTGDINYLDAFRESERLSPGVPVSTREPLRQMKTSVIVFATLVSRAAMEGGLSPEIAYALGDDYINRAEKSHDPKEIARLATDMYEDFIRRVHELGIRPDYSLTVRKCCDYLELHFQENISLSELAKLTGYSEYYLTEKFKKETGETVNAYIRRKKIERAKILLLTTALSVGEIAERLSFCTPNYFIQCFREDTGLTPARFRKEQ